MVTWNDGGDVVVTGSDALTKPGGSQFAVSGGNGPYSWSVSGTGVTISQAGYLTLGELACGTYTITCTDCAGKSGIIIGRVSNSGSWSNQTVLCYYVYCNPLYFCEILVENMKYVTTWCLCGSSDFQHSPYLIPCGMSWGEDPTLSPCDPVCPSDTGFVPGEDPCNFSTCRKVTSKTSYEWTC
jgi:hypothetical protein